MAEFMVPISVFAMIFGIVYIVSRRKERMYMMDKGITPDSFRTESRSQTNLKWGLFLVAIGIGLILANWLAESGAMSEEAAYFSMIFLFGGVALVVSHFLGKNKKTGREK
jgi:hypothetical protein